MTERHRLILENDTGQDVIFVCPEAGCGRRLAVSRSHQIVVIHQGDFYALHSGGTDGLDIALDLAS